MRDRSSSRAAIAIARLPHDQEQRTMTEKFTVKKFCPICRKHHEHKEARAPRAERGARSS